MSSAFRICNEPQLDPDTQAEVSRWETLIRYVEDGRLEIDAIPPSVCLFMCFEFRG